MTGMFEFDGQAYKALLEDYPELGYTKWTADKVDALERIADDHLSNCDECQESFEIYTLEDIDNEVHRYCPVGESVQETWLEADLEFSWQPDWPGHGAWCDQQLAELDRIQAELRKNQE